MTISLQMFPQVSVDDSFSCTTRSRLSIVSLEDRRRLLQDGLTAKDLAKAEHEIQALHEIEVCGVAGLRLQDASSLRVVAWNLQQCHFPKASAAVLAREKADLVLLTEVDVGMRRTGQHHTIGEIADTMGVGYAFAVEFLELVETDSPFLKAEPCENNQLGFHGNALLFHHIPLRPVIIRLRAEADWFIQPRRGQYRIGGRMAVAAIFPLCGKEFVAVTVHLESDTDAAGRERQMRDLLVAIDSYAKDRPVLIGGDFNTGARRPDFDYTTEGLFAAAEEFGYRWRDCNIDAPTSRISLIPNAVRQDRAHYDWFFVRDLQVDDPAIIPAVDEQGNALSDHEAIALTISMKPQTGETLQT